MGYVYGGRPLGESSTRRTLLTKDVQFNPSWHEFGPGASKGGQGEVIA